MLKVIPCSKRSHHSFSTDGTWYVDVTRQGDIKNVIKRGGYRAWFYATMLENTVIKVTFGYLRAQQISAIIFRCGVLYHTEFDFLWLFIHLGPRKNGFKYLALLINIFILWNKHNLDLLCWARYVSICSIYFICQKGSHRFLPIFFSQLLRTLFSLNL